GDRAFSRLGNQRQRREEMSGHVRQRGKKGQWYAVIDVSEGDKRKRRWHKLDNCNGKREAQKACEQLIAQQGEGTYVDRSKMTVAEFVRERINRIALDVREQQRIVGQPPCPELHPSFEHRLAMSRPPALDFGALKRVPSAFVCSTASRTWAIFALHTAPKVPEAEMVIVRDMPAFLTKLQDSSRLYILAMVALFTGMRLGEVLALRWNRVDLDTCGEIGPRCRDSV